MITYTAPMWVGLFIGFIIDAVAEIWGISNPDNRTKRKPFDRAIKRCYSLSTVLGTSFVRLIILK